MRAPRASALPNRENPSHLTIMPPISTLSRIVLVLLVISAVVQIILFALG